MNSAMQMDFDSKTFSKYITAAQVIARNGSVAEAEALVFQLWQSDRIRKYEFKVFQALVECRLLSEPNKVLELLNKLVDGCPDLDAFWQRRSLAEKAAAMDWLGQLYFSLGKSADALENFNRAASLGRDSSQIWRQLSELSALKKDLRLSLRYMQRSLELYRQLDLNLLSGAEFQLGEFLGKHPLRLTHRYEDFLETLLCITKVAKGQKNLKSVRELVVEMIHLFPQETGLKKIRLMLESALVRFDLQYLRAPNNRRA